MVPYRACLCSLRLLHLTGVETQGLTVRLKYGLPAFIVVADLGCTLHQAYLMHTDLPSSIEEYLDGPAIQIPIGFVRQR